MGSGRGSASADRQRRSMAGCETATASAYRQIYPGHASQPDASWQTPGPSALGPHPMWPVRRQGRCGGQWAHGCLNHHRRQIYANNRSIRREVLDQRKPIATRHPPLSNPTAASFSNRYRHTRAACPRALSSPPSRSISSLASSRAGSISAAICSGVASFSAASPDCRVPSTSPAPRSRKSSSAIRSPS